MNGAQENKLSMALVVKDVLVKFSDVVKTPLAFAKSALDLDNVIALINGHAQVQALRVTGKRITKEDAATAAIESCMVVLVLLKLMRWTLVIKSYLKG